MEKTKRALTGTTTSQGFSLYYRNTKLTAWYGVIDRVRESRNPKKVIRVSLMESYGEIGRVPVNLLWIRCIRSLPQGTTNRGTTGTIHPDLPVFSRVKSLAERHKKTRVNPWFTRDCCWRSGWDSNPRAREDYLISSQARYDHFDTLPYNEEHPINAKNIIADILSFFKYHSRIFLMIKRNAQYLPTLCILELVVGLEPTTCALRMRCSTNWAIQAVNLFLFGVLSLQNAYLL